jgi:epoxyqueuosine reductase
MFIDRRGVTTLDVGRVKARVRELGADLVGIAAAEPLEKEADELARWLRLGYNGTMAWMAERVDVRNDPSRLLPGCRSIIVIAVNYHAPQLHLRFPNFPKISRYAWGRDYHPVLSGILRSLAGEMQEWAREEGVDDFRYRVAVDTAPFRDKVWAQRAGIGWQGKNTLLLTREFGSWVFIGSLLTTLQLEPDRPHPDHCGTCTRCIEACPTRAIVYPRKLDARACISYLTIEHAGQLPARYGENLNGWIFGCDVCQDVCPWNRFARPTRNKSFYPREGLLIPDLHVFGHMDEDSYDRLTAGTPIRRAGRERLRRNALAVMGLL